MIETIKKLSEFSNKSLIIGFLDSKLNQKFSKILEKELLNKIQKKYYNNVFILNNGFKIHLICLNSDLICGFRPDFAFLQESFDYMTCFPFISQKNTTIYVFKDNFQEINLLHNKQEKYTFSEEEIKDLIFSVWEVAYNEGVSEGESSCSSYYHGHVNSKPIKAKEAWIDRVEWRIISESENFDITNSKNWNNINY